MAVESTAVDVTGSHSVVRTARETGPQLGSAYSHPLSLKCKFYFHSKFD